MPRVTHVKAARQDNSVCKKGESYYWWKFKNCGKSRSLTYPKPSQLTRSPYLGSVYDLIDQVNAFEPEPGEEGVIETFGEEITEGITEIRDQCQESLDNMPESLQYSPTGELLQERIDACDSAESECMPEEPDQWVEERERIEERDEWEGNEPSQGDFKSSELFDEAHEDWENGEVDEPEGFEDFDASDMANAVEGMLI